MDLFFLIEHHLKERLIELNANNTKYGYKKDNRQID